MAATLLRVGAALLLSGCTILGTGVGAVDEPEKEGIQLYPTAAGLKGLNVTDICAFSKRYKLLDEVPIRSDTIRNMVNQVKPSVVNIYVETAQPVGVYLLGLPLPGARSNIPGKALGSGFICHPNGFILTNAHVVSKAQQLSAKMHDGHVHELEILALDHQADIALLRFVDQGRYPFLPMIFTDSLSEGDWVIAIGNPLGINHMVSHGIVSHRLMLKDSETDSPRLAFLLSDTPINPGNSGGPLIELGGNAVGINTAILRETQGISLTIPSERVRDFIEQVLEKVGRKN
jgi:serine protease Do